MNLNDIRLIAFDIDGTLLNSNGECSAETMKRIHLLRDKGYIPTLVSGRTFNSVCGIARTIDIEGPFVAYNGAYVSMPDEEPLFSQPIPWESVKPLLMELENEEIYLKVYVDDTLYVEKKTEETLKFSKVHGVEFLETGIGGLSTLEKDPLKIVIIETPSKILEIYEKLKPWGNAFKIYKEDRGIEIVHKESNKAHGLRILCQHYGISMNQVMAFGNEGNDLEMLTEAGIGVAMGNAPQYVQQSADIITKSNDEEGISWALDMLR